MSIGGLPSPLLRDYRAASFGWFGFLSAPIPFDSAASDGKIVIIIESLHYQVDYCIYIYIESELGRLVIGQKQYHDMGYPGYQSRQSTS